MMMDPALRAYKLAKPHEKVPSENALRTWYEGVVAKVQREHKSFLQTFASQPNLLELAVLYYVTGYLNNISLSVHPDTKKYYKARYGLSHELFGSFFNTDPTMTYCSQFPDLEGPRATCNALNFVPEPGRCYLVNPPYTVDWIRWSLNNVMHKWKQSNFIVIVPVWDVATRKRYGIQLYADFPEITEAMTKCKWHRTRKDFKFWNGLTQKTVLLKDPIHVFYF